MSFDDLTDIFLTPGAEALFKLFDETPPANVISLLSNSAVRNFTSIFDVTLTFSSFLESFESLDPENIDEILIITDTKTITPIAI